MRLEKAWYGVFYYITHFLKAFAGGAQTYPKFCDVIMNISYGDWK
jgi:hypothetical protein